MESQPILHQLREGVAEVTLNRPEVLNSFNKPMARQLQSLLAEAADDPRVRCVLLAGAGRAFCAGQDLAEAVPSQGPPADVEEIVRHSYNPLIRTLRVMEKPVVAAVQGTAAGAGANIALACDFVIAASDASFLQAFCKIGLIPDSGGTYFLPRLAGFARASAMAMLGEKLPAEEALRAGLVYKVVPPSDLAEEARQLAVRLARMPTRALGLTKIALNRSLENDLERQLEIEAELQGVASRTRDYREGVAAFLEKRKPKFTGG